MRNSTRTNSRRAESPRVFSARIACAIVVLAALPRAVLLADDAPRVLPLEGSAFYGELVGITSDGPLLFSTEGESGEEQRTVPLDEFLLWGTPPEPGSASRFAANEAAQLILAGGGVLVADILSADGEAIEIDSRLFGAKRVPLAHVAAILLVPPADFDRRAELIQSLWDPRASADRVVLSNGDTLTGALHGIAAKQGQPLEIAFETNLGASNLPLTQVKAIVLDPASLARVEPGKFQIGFADGSLVHAAGLEIGPGAMDTREASFTPNGVDAWTVDAEKLTYLEYANPRVEWLAARQPDRFQHIPFLSLEWDWRANHNAVGQPLRVAGQRYPHGIGVHSACQITYVLNEPAKRFEAEIAVDDAAGDFGSVIFRVVTFHRRDGQTVREEQFTSPMVRGGDRPAMVSVDLSDAVGFSLIVDFGDGGEQLDFADWLNARLVRE